MNNDLMEELVKRSSNKCELCSSEQDLSVHLAIETEDLALLLCGECTKFVENPSCDNSSHFQCLSESMWSEYPAVTIMSSRILSFFRSESWALELFEQLYLDEEMQKLADAHPFESEESSSSNIVVKDSNGAVLKAGDSVTLIKDLVVKGANFTAKRGTLVKNISMTDNPKHIEGKVNGTQIVLVADFLKLV
jgi:protein PhnA